MSLQIGDTAPDFTANTTEGKIHFYDYIEGHWAVLFSHPEELYAGLHDRAGLYGVPEAGVRQARCEGAGG